MPFRESQFEKSPAPSAEKAKSAEEIGTEAITLMYEPAKKILNDLRENIERGQYVAILGDDASGRLPALLFGKIINSIYEERKFDRLKTIFFAGSDFGRADQKEKIQQDFANFLEKAGIKKIARGRKVLFVTDTIASGLHLHPFAHKLREIGIDFDIMTIGITAYPAESVSDIEKRLGGKIFFGEQHTPKIYRRYDLSGVAKIGGHSLFAKREPLFDQSYHRRSRARKDVGLLAQKLIKWYHEESK